MWSPGASLYLLVMLLLTRACDSWFFETSDYDEYDEYDHADDAHLFPEVSPATVRTERCDACRIVAARFDAAFEMAEARLLGPGQAWRDELNEAEVNQIVGQVCTRRAFSEVYPFFHQGHSRLAAPGVCTWRTYRARMRKGLGNGLEERDEDRPFSWPQRMKNHCRNYAEKLRGMDLYDMWLRTSAGYPEGFDSFLCHGEGPYADCVRRIDEGEKWPAGDDRPEGENEDDEENEDDGDNEDRIEELSFLRQAGWRQHRPSASSASALRPLF